MFASSKRQYAEYIMAVWFSHVLSPQNSPCIELSRGHMYFCFFFLLIILFFIPAVHHKDSFLKAVLQINSCLFTQQYTSFEDDNKGEKDKENWKAAGKIETRPDTRAKTVRRALIILRPIPSSIRPIPSSIRLIPNSIRLPLSLISPTPSSVRPITSSFRPSPSSLRPIPSSIRPNRSWLF